MDKIYAHRYNGIYLEFENGNSISTIWGVGSYSDNHDGSFTEFDRLIKAGSKTVEIMPNSKDTKLLKRIFKKCGQNYGDDNVIGYLNIKDWLWVVNQLADAGNN